MHHTAWTKPKGGILPSDRIPPKTQPPSQMSKGTNKGKGKNKQKDAEMPKSKEVRGLEKLRDDLRKASGKERDPKGGCFCQGLYPRVSPPVLVSRRLLSTIKMHDQNALNTGTGTDGQCQFVIIMVSSSPHHVPIGSTNACPLDAHAHLPILRPHPLRAQPPEPRLPTLRLTAPPPIRTRRPHRDARSPHRRNTRQRGCRPPARHTRRACRRGRLPHSLRNGLSRKHPRVGLGRAGLASGQPDAQSIIPGLKDTQGEGVVVYPACCLAPCVCGEGQGGARTGVQARPCTPCRGRSRRWPPGSSKALGECSWIECHICIAWSGIAASNQIIVSSVFR